MKYRNCSGLAKGLCSPDQNPKPGPRNTIHTLTLHAKEVCLQWLGASESMKIIASPPQLQSTSSTITTLPSVTVDQRLLAIIRRISSFTYKRGHFMSSKVIIHSPLNSILFARILTWVSECLLQTPPCHFNNSPAHQTLFL